MCARIDLRREYDDAAAAGGAGGAARGAEPETAAGEVVKTRQADLFLRGLSRREG